MRRRSFGTVKVAFLDRNKALDEIRACARILCRYDARVLAVAVFGSLARGDATPTSDADVLVVLEDHPLRRWFDRIPEYAHAFSKTSLPVEAFPYTRAELRRLAETGGFLSRVLHEAILVAGDIGALHAFR